MPEDEWEADINKNISEIGCVGMKRTCHFSLCPVVEFRERRPIKAENFSVG